MRTFSSYPSVEQSYMMELKPSSRALTQVSYLRPWSRCTTTGTPARLAMGSRNQLSSSSGP